MEQRASSSFPPSSRCARPISRLADGSTRIIAVADTAQSLFGMGSYRGSSARLIGLAWSAESLRNDIGAETDRDPSGAYTGPYRLARDLTLLAATAAGVAAIDTAFADLRYAEGLRAEALAARRDGFAGKIAIDPAQAAIINDAFSASTAARGADIASRRVKARKSRLLASHPHPSLARLNLGHPFLGVLRRAQTTFTYSLPSGCTRSVRAIMVCAFNAHIMGLSTDGPSTTSVAVFA